MGQQICWTLSTLLKNFSVLLNCLESMNIERGCCLSGDNCVGIDYMSTCGDSSFRSTYPHLIPPDNGIHDRNPRSHWRRSQLRVRNSRRLLQRDYSVRPHTWYVRIRNYVFRSRPDMQVGIYTCIFAVTLWNIC